MNRKLIVAGVLGALMMGGAASASAQEPRAQVFARRAPSAWIGIMFQETGAGGAPVVSRVYEDSPAEAAGLEVGDTILVWNGRRDVAAAIAEGPLTAGDRVRVQVRRGGNAREVEITAAARPVIIEGFPGTRSIRIFPDSAAFRGLRADSLVVRADTLAARMYRIFADSLGPRLRALERDIPAMARTIPFDSLRTGIVREFDGFTIAFARSVSGAEFTDLNEQLGSYFGTQEGVLVIEVAEGTPAARGGLLPGDVVLQVDGQPVASVVELRRSLSRPEARDADGASLTILRKGSRQTIQFGAREQVR